MSEQKNHNDINLNDEFLNLDFGDHADSPNLESSTNTLPANETEHETGVDTSLETDIFNDATLDLGAIDAPSTPTDSISSEYDFLRQLDLLNQSNQAQIPDNIGAEEVAIAATAAVASTIKPSDTNLDTNKTPTTEKPALTPKPISNKKSKLNKSAKPSSKDSLGSLLSNPKQLNKLILGGIIAVLLIAAALYMTTKNSEKPSLDAPTPVPATNTPPEPAAQPAAETTEVALPASTVASTPVATDDSILPNIKPVANPDEILNAEIPNDPTLIKEEIDRLADKDSRIAEQEKLIAEQLTMMEDLTTAKAEQIALLEAQIAELEKQKGNASEQK